MGARIIETASPLGESPGWHTRELQRHVIHAVVEIYISTDDVDVSDKGGYTKLRCGGDIDDAPATSPRYYHDKGT